MDYKVNGYEESVKQAFYNYLNEHRESQRSGQLVMNAYINATGIGKPEGLPDVWEIDDRSHPDVERWYEAFYMRYVSNF